MRLSTIGFESLTERDTAVWKAAVKWESEKHLDEPVKSKKSGSFVKKPSYGAQILRSEAHLSTPQRLRDAA
jgi:hypothetical protein